MNTSSAKLNRLVRASRGTVLAAALVLSGGLPTLCLAQPSPIGTWDCLSSGGGQPGIAFFTFTSTPSNTFTADLLTAPVPNTPTSPRSSLITQIRDNSTNSIPIPISTNLFGFNQVDGPWSFDSKGRVIGSFIQIIPVAPIVTVNWNPIKVDTGPIPFFITNYYTSWITQTTSIPFYVEGAILADRYRSPTNVMVPIPFDGPAFQATIEWTATNAIDGYTNTYSTNITVYNNTYTYPSVTNFTYSFADYSLDTNAQWTVVSPEGYINNYSEHFYFIDTLGYTLSGVVTNHNSFVGTVVPNKRLTLHSSTTYGTVTYTGVPMNVNKLPNISGNWYAIKLQDGEHYAEQLFNLTPSTSPYLYFADNGQGPGYSLNGFVMVSSKKRIGFSLDQLAWGDTNSILRASLGPLTVSPKTTRTKTRGIDQTGVPFDFTATLQP